MIAGPNSRRIAACLFLIGGLLLQVPCVLAPPPEDPTPSTQETINVIKQRAEQILAERKRAKQLQFYGEASQGFGFERNPSYSSNHKSSAYSEEDLYLLLSKKLAPQWTWQGIYSGSYTHYFKLMLDTYSYQTLTPLKLIWKPNRMWRIDGGVDLTHLWYLDTKDSKSSSYQELKPWTGVRQNLWGSWFHAIRYSWFLRHYTSARARDGLGRATLSLREDTRDAFRYELGTTWKDTLLKGRYDYYLNDSNDARNDFYDAQDNKFTLSISRPLTKKLSALASFSHELKHYAHRPVGGIAPKKVRYDEIYTWNISGSYDFNPTWSLNPAFMYTRNNSNDPTGEYYDWTASVALTAHF